MSKLNRAMRPEFASPAREEGALAKKSVTSPFNKEEDPNENPSPFRKTRPVPVFVIVPNTVTSSPAVPVTLETVNCV
jgi:hypothetical protein